MSDFKSDAAPRRPTVEIYEENAGNEIPFRFARLEEEADQRRGRV